MTRFTKYQKQSQNTSKKNTNTEDAPDIKIDDTIYRTNPLRNKNLPAYIPMKIINIENNKLTGKQKKN